MISASKSNTIIYEIKEVLLEETRFLQEYGYDQIVEKDDFWKYTLSFISLVNDYAIEYEIDFREGVVSVLITTLDDHKLPGGYYMNDGKRVRTHLEHYLINKNINSKMSRTVFELNRKNMGDMSQKIILLIKAYSMLVKENLAYIDK